MKSCSHNRHSLDTAWTPKRDLVTSNCALNPSMCGLVSLPNSRRLAMFCDPCKLSIVQTEVCKPLSAREPSRLWMSGFKEPTEITR